MESIANYYSNIFPEKVQCVQCSHFTIEENILLNKCYVPLSNQRLTISQAHFQFKYSRDFSIFYHQQQQRSIECNKMRNMNRTKEPNGTKEKLLFNLNQFIFFPYRMINNLYRKVWKNANTSCASDSLEGKKI